MQPPSSSSQIQVDERATYDEKKPQADEPFSHNILDNDPQSRFAIRVYFKILLMITILITLTIWSILSIYWGECRQSAILENDSQSPQVPTGGPRRPITLRYRN